MISVVFLIVAFGALLAWVKISQLRYKKLVIKLKKSKTKFVLLVATGVLIVSTTLPISPPINQSQVYNKNLDVYFVVDTSLSMMANDYDGGKTRLDGVKAKVKPALDQLVGARFTLISFEGVASVEMPGMYDKESFAQAIDDLETPTSYRAKGTAFAPALKLAADRVGRAQKQENLQNMRRVVILISDGEQIGKDSDSTTALAQLKSMINNALVIGVGTEQGSTMKAPTTYYGGPNYDQTEWDYVPDYKSKNNSGPKTKYGAPAAISKADYGNLDRLAKGLGGKMIRLSDSTDLKADFASLARDTSYRDNGDKRNLPTAPNSYYWLVAIIIIGLILVFHYWLVFSYYFRKIRRGHK